MDIDCIESDFENLMATSGIAAEVDFGNGLAVKAAVTEITFDAELELGGTRRKRAWTATCLRKTLNGRFVRAGDLVSFDGLNCRVAQVRWHKNLPLTEIDFEER